MYARLEYGMINTYTNQVMHPDEDVEDDDIILQIMKLKAHQVIILI